MRISDWSSDVCSSDLAAQHRQDYNHHHNGNRDDKDSAAHTTNASDPAESMASTIAIAPSVGDADDEQNSLVAAANDRSEERRVGKECVSTCRSRCRLLS